MEKINILILEDNKLDTELIIEEMTAYNIDFSSKQVDTKAGFTDAIQYFQPDIILSDYSLPQFTGFEALTITQELVPDIPFILVTGHLSEEVAAEAIKRGAWDYVLKENLLRIGPAIENALKLKEEKDKNILAEKELIKLSSAVKQSANSIIITDIEGKIVYTNPKFTNLTGYTAEEAFGKNPNLLSTGKQSNEYYSKLWNTIKKGNVWKGEFQNKSKNGDLFWEQATISPIKDAEGNIIYFLAIKEDISKLKKSEENLLDAQKIAKIGSYNLNLKTKISATSLSFDNIVGIDSKKELTFEIWRTITHPEDSADNQKMLDSCIRSKKRFDREYRILTLDTKELKWIHGLGKVIYENGNPTNFVGTIQDITERKEIERKLIKSERLNRAVTETAADAIITTDPIGNITSWNKAAEQLFGYSASEVINKNVDILVPQRYLIEHQVVLGKVKPNKTQKTSKKSHNYNVFGLRKDGTEFPIEFSLSNWEVKNQKFVTSIIRDITERKQAELVLQKAYSEVESLKKQLEEENISLKDEISLSFNYEDLIYSSVEISDVLTQVEQVSNTDATVLLLGETGTGKELIAKAIHSISDRKDKPLIYVNCAAIPTELIESELFGHKKGSFTGAINNRIGKFQLADKGTLFLDEIGELPFELQPKLLRAIQNAEIVPVGGSKSYKLDIRIIAATNKDLEKEVDENHFREDLFFRLNVFPITIPPLRERIEDIPVLIDHFINKFSKKYRKEIKFISFKTLQQMKVYSWPGNVRELENLIERAVITADQNRLVFQEFDNTIEIDKSIKKNKYTSLEEIQSNYIIKTLNLCKWKISGKDGAAALLDIKPSTLRDRMKKFGIIRPKQ